MSESSAKPRAVVDTNLFVSGALSLHGPPRRLLYALDDDRFRLVIADRQRTELIDVFGRSKLARRFRLPQQDLDDLLDRVSTTETTPLHRPLPVVVRDPNDEHILAAALGGAADYLVTGDDDLLSLAGDPRLGRLQIVTVVAFLALLDDEEPIS